MPNIENSRSAKLDAIFGTPLFAVLLAIGCNVLWGSAFPFIKMGYRLFAIETSDTASILCFAGVRFMLGSLLVLAGSLILEGKLPQPPCGKVLGECCALGLWQTTAQYAFYYMAVALLTGAFGGILNSTQSFLGVIFAHFLYGDADRMTPAKTLGCVLGFAGVTAPYRFDNSYGWVGISHCGIFDDGAGNWFYTSQGRFPVNVGGNEYSNAIMMGHVRSIRWDANGWPLVMPERYGAVPQAPITENEIAGDWEHLALTNNTGTQRTSETMTYDLDTHKITSGSWKNATWTFDAATQTITTSAGVVLYLQREVDWEASPRTHTIVYAAQGNQKTYWGKKLQ